MATNKEQAKKVIEKLVTQFGEQYQSYSRSSYDEAQLRVDFINKFFKALGWDVDNDQELAEDYREVIYEDKLKIGKSTKAPDYGFRLSGSLRRLFFVEAKKPAVPIKTDKSAAYQLRRYGRSAQTPVSILTNFEALAIYDCTKRPSENDSAAVGRIKYLHYEEYIKEFDFIYDTLSREAVVKGRFDKYVQSDTQKRGSVTLDTDFVESLNNWRKYLAVSIAKNNLKLNEEHINYAVQQTIDRLIFLRFCEDRAVEHYGNLKNATTKGDTYQNLLQIFTAADNKYNSGLFDLKDDTITTQMKVDNKVIKNIVDDLYYPKCEYEFSVMPVEILGNAYEQFLGKVIRITAAHSVKIDDKPEVRKAGGVYYTPQYIVDYIVEHTVGELVKGKSPKEIEKIKIVDPACGSGSFLLGAFRYLQSYHTKWYIDNGYREKKNGGGVLTPEGRLTTAEKRKILLNNIYGVDLDSNAVEVSKLSLLLKSMEGETEASINQQLKFFHERVLPDLDKNIVCGNSLIGHDFFDSELGFDGVEKAELQKRIKPFDWKMSFPSVFKQGGFDAVVGNPPYVRQELLGSEQKDYFQKRYKVFHGVADLYSYFFEKGIELLKKDGFFGIIVANKWMRANYGEPLRKWLKGQNIKEIVDFGDLQVFRGATTYPCIIICGNGKVEKQVEVTSMKTLDFESLQKYVTAHRITIEQKSLDDKGWNLASDKQQNILKKIFVTGVPLGNYVNNKIYYGIKTGLNEAFVIDETTKQQLIKTDKRSIEIIKPFLAGRDIKRYQPPISNKYVLFTKRGIDIDKYPAIKKHLQRFKEQLMPKPKDFNGNKWQGRKEGTYKWFEIQDAVDYYQEFEKVKILWPGISSMVACFTMDFDKYYGNDNNQLIISDDKYLLGILNSAVSKFQLINICDKVQGGFYRLKIIYIEQLSIKQPSTKTEKLLHDKIVAHVETMLDLNKELQQTHTPTAKQQLESRIAYTDKKIDELVYELYGLNEEEIKIIENTQN